MRATLTILGLYEYDNSIFDLMSLPGTLTKEDVANQICFECAELEVLYPSATVIKNLIGLWSAREYPTWVRVLAAAQAEYNPIENYDRSESISRSRTGSETHSGKDTNQDSGTDISQDSGKDTSQDSGTDTTQDSGTDTTQGSSTNTNSGSDSNLHKYSAFDSGTLLDQSSDTTTYGSGSTGSSSSSTNYGRKNELTHGRKNELTHGRKNEFTHGRKSELTHGHQIADTSTETENNRIHGNIGVTTSQQMLEQELEIVPKLNILSYIVDSFKRRFCLLVY